MWLLKVITWGFLIGGAVGGAVVLLLWRKRAGSKGAASANAMQPSEHLSSRENPPALTLDAAPTIQDIEHVLDNYRTDVTIHSEDRPDETPEAKHTDPRYQTNAITETRSADPTNAEVEHLDQRV